MCVLCWAALLAACPGQDLITAAPATDTLLLSLEGRYQAYKATRDAVRLSRVLAELSAYHHDQGRLALALRYALERTALLTKQPRADHLPGALRAAAALYAEEQLYDDANRLYLQAYYLPDSLRGPADDLLDWRGLSDSYAGRALPDSSLLYEEKILDYYQDRNDLDGRLRTLQRMADLYSAADRPVQTLVMHRRMLALVDNRPERRLTLITTLNNLGTVNNRLEQYEEAVAYFRSAIERAEEAGGHPGLATMYTNLAVASFNANNTDQAIRYFRDAKRRLQPGEDTERARIDHLLAVVYLRDKDYYNAGVSNEASTELAKLTGNARQLMTNYSTAAGIHQALYEYEEALDDYQRHLDLRDSFLLEERLRQQDIAQQQILLERAEKEIKLLLVNQEVQDLTINQLELERDTLRLASANLELTTKRQEDQLALLRREQEVQQAELKNRELQALQSRQQLDLANQQVRAARQERQIAELSRREAIQQAELERTAAAEARQRQQNELLQRENEISALRIAGEDEFRRLVSIIIGALVLVLGLMIAGFVLARRNNRKLETKNEEIEAQREALERNQTQLEAEKRKSDELLLNILPAQTAIELRETGKAEPRLYESATVMFTDFGEFTRIAQTMQPDELLAQLNHCFGAFDRICETHGLEKIKTIGDAYMCVGGLPVSNTTHAQDAVRAALAMQAWMRDWQAEQRAQGKPHWEMRVGIHTGRVVAGVVGTKKFIYDVWGDAVNIASRMETGGALNRINVSRTTYDLVREDFVCTYRGAVEVKNAGEIEMYFVEG